MTSKTRQLIQEKKHVPRCVTVYNKLFTMIMEGKYKEGDKLETEPVLAKEMGVSRTTLRQALSLLREDGMIRNQQGRGNFVLGKKKPLEHGLEILENPLLNILEGDLTKVEMEFRIEAGAEHSTKVLQRAASVVVYVDLWYKKEEKVMGYSLGILPVETVLSEHLDLSKEEEVKDYLLYKVYQRAKSSKVELEFTTSKDFYEMTHKFAKEEKIYLLKEAIYQDSEEPVAYFKHYIPVKVGHISIHRRQDFFQELIKK